MIIHNNYCNDKFSYDKEFVYDNAHNVFDNISNDSNVTDTDN